jgi:methylmalonyl-CoA mutase N-terminal domain/subunit
MTDDLANQLWAMLDDIEKRGGALECISSGYFQKELSDSAYQLALEVDRGERIVVGVNKFKGESPSLEVFRVDPASEAAQVNALRQLKNERDNDRVTKALAALKEAAANEENTVPACIEAVKAYATVGEIVNVLREVYGKWTPNTVF